MRKLIKQLREFSPRRNNYYIEWTIKFVTDDEYLLALIPTIQFEPWIYRRPNCPVIDVTWMHMHILIGTWRSKMYFNDLLMKEITLNEFEASGALAMVNQILSWHGLALAMDHEGGVFGDASRLCPVKLKTNIMFDEEEVVAAKRRMNGHMLSNARHMVDKEGW